MKPTRFAALAEHVASGLNATFTGIVYRCVGVERGKKGAKIRYGDALVSEVLVTGFDYGKLLERSIDAATTGVAFFEAVKKLASNRLEAKCPDDDTIQSLINAQIDSWRDSLTPDGGIDETWYKPLEVGGTPVRGGKVYCGEGVGQQGQIYLAGLLISKKVLEYPANGYWNANSRPSTVVKSIVREVTPIGRYKTRRLSPNNLVALRVGGNAARYIEEIGQEITDDAVAFLGGLED